MYFKERRFKEEIVDLAKSIIKETQEVVRISTSTAEACTDRTMKSVSCLLKHGKIVVTPLNSVCNIEKLGRAWGGGYL